jgi:hypothetical protein
MIAAWFHSKSEGDTTCICLLWLSRLREWTIDNTTFRKLDLFPSSDEWKTPNLLCPLKRADVNHWTTPISITTWDQALSKADNKVIIWQSVVSGNYMAVVVLTGLVQWVRLALRGLTEWVFPTHLRTETDPVSERLCCLVFNITDDG